MEYLVVKNWQKYQHYTKRNPPWIKLHTNMIDEYHEDGTVNKVRRLSEKAWRLYFSICVLASQLGGRVPLDNHYIANRTGADTSALDELLASTLLARCKQDATEIVPQRTETETETETENREQKEDSCTSCTSAPDGAVCSDSDLFGANDSQDEAPKPEPAAVAFSAFVDRLVCAWNEMAETQPKLRCVRKVNSALRDVIRTRHKDAQWRAEVFEAIEAIPKCAFYRGDVKSWASSFKWLMQADKVTNVLDAYQREKHTPGAIRREADVKEFVL